MKCKRCWSVHTDMCDQSASEMMYVQKVSGFKLRVLAMQTKCGIYWQTFGVSSRRFLCVYSQKKEYPFVFMCKKRLKKENAEKESRMEYLELRGFYLCCHPPAGLVSEILCSFPVGIQHIWMFTIRDNYCRTIYPRDESKMLVITATFTYFWSLSCYTDCV